MSALRQKGGPLSQVLLYDARRSTWIGGLHVELGSCGKGRPRAGDRRRPHRVLAAVNDVRHSASGAGPSMGSGLFLHSRTEREPLRLSPVMGDRTLSIALTWLSILVPVLAVLMMLLTLID